MEKEKEINISSNEKEMYKCLAEFRAPLINSIIRSIGILAGCGTVYITEMLAQYVGENGHVTGLDLSEELSSFAGKSNQRNNIQFMSKLQE